MSTSMFTSGSTSKYMSNVYVYVYVYVYVIIYDYV